MKIKTNNLENQVVANIQLIDGDKVESFVKTIKKPQDKNGWHWSTHLSRGSSSSMHLSTSFQVWWYCDNIELLGLTFTFKFFIESIS